MQVYIGLISKVTLGKENRREGKGREGERKGKGRNHKLT